MPPQKAGHGEEADRDGIREKLLGLRKVKAAWYFESELQRRLFTRRPGRKAGRRGILWKAYVLVPSALLVLGGLSYMYFLQPRSGSEAGESTPQSAPTDTVAVSHEDPGRRDSVARVEPVRVSEAERPQQRRVIGPGGEAAPAYQQVTRPSSAVHEESGITAPGVVKADSAASVRTDTTRRPAKKDSLRPAARPPVAPVPDTSGL